MSGLYNTAIETMGATPSTGRGGRASNESLVQMEEYAHLHRVQPFGSGKRRGILSAPQTMLARRSGS